MENVKIINADAENLPIKDDSILFGVGENTSFSKYRKLFQRFTEH